MLGALTHAVIEHFSPEGLDARPDDSAQRPATRAEQIELMVEVDIQNVPWDLLFVAEGLKPEQSKIYWHEKGSHWPVLHRRRVDELLALDTQREVVDQPRASHLGAEESTDQFRAALVRVVDSYELARRGR